MATAIRKRTTGAGGRSATEIAPVREIGRRLGAYISERDGSAQVAVRLTPRASRQEIVGPRGSVLAVKVNSPPVEDRANDALRRLIAKAVGIPPSSVQIVRGHKSRDKLLQLKGVAANEAARRLA